MQYFTRSAGTTLPNINVGQNDGINYAEAKKKKIENHPLFNFNFVPSNLNLLSSHFR